MNRRGYIIHIPMTTPSFNESYNKLNPGQKEAVDTIEGPVMVIAGPGTGKTQVLTLRIANILLQTQIDPSNILALTFTESAVLAMRKRLVEMIGTAGYKVELTTFHSFCNDIIKRNPEDFPDLISANSITEVEQIQLLEDILNGLTLELLKPFGDPLYHLKNILSGINDLKKEGVNSDDLVLGIEEQKKDFEKIEDLCHDKGAYKGQMKGKYQEIQKNIQKTEELLIVYRKYQEELRKQRMYDFNDMLLQVITELQKNQGLLLRLQEQYQYILVDEHQDTNTAQNKLIELLASFYDDPNLFVVGDEKQAIFRFQGASLENFLYFQKLFPKAKLVHLEHNYRSTQTILDAAASLIVHNASSEILQKTSTLIANAQYPNDLIKIAILNDYHSEYYYLAEDIKRKIANGVSAKEIAVLCRNNRDLLPLSTVLEQVGVPFNIEADQNIFADGDIRKLVMLFKAVCNFGSDRELMELLHADFLQINYLDLYRIIRVANTQKKPMIDIISSDQSLKDIGVEDEKPFLELSKKLQSWKQLCSNENLETVFVRLAEESGLIKWILQKPNSLDIIDKLSGLYEDIKMHTQRNANYKLEDYLGYLDLLESHDILIKRAPRTTLRNAVRLMTAHRSKGLEFDYVYIINSFDGHWGNQKKRSSGIKIPWEYLGVKLKLDVELEESDDERRLFYVALTRARKGVVIAYSTRSLEGKEQVASQFVEEIEEQLKELVTVEEFETEFLSHKEQLFSSHLISKPEMKDADFFRQLFFEHGLSATALNNYLKCPWRYFYRNLIRLPDVKDKSLIFGSAVHNALNKYIKFIKTNESSEEFLVDAYKDALKKETIDGLDYQELLSRGERVLRGFYQSRAKEWPKDLQTELYIGGLNLTEDIRLTGKIDVIQPLENKHVVVYDFKTGKPKSRGEIEGTTASGTGDYKRQLVFYKLLLDRYLSGKMDMVQGIVEFIEPDAKGSYKFEQFDITAEEVHALEEQVIFVGKEIINLDFWERRCDDKDCEYCKLRDIMLQGS